MFHLVDKLSAKLRSRHTKTLSHALPLKPGRQGCTWSPAEIRFLLACEQGRRPLVVQFPSNGHRYQTFIVGIDLVAGQLLLDHLFPCPPIHCLAAEEPFSLVAKLPQGEYHVWVQPREIMANRQLLVDIITTSVSQPLNNTTRPEAVQFSERAPLVHLQLKSGQHVQARLISLFEGGAHVALDGPSARTFHQPQSAMRCTIAFNNSFELRCMARTNQLAQALPKLLLSKTSLGRSHGVTVTFTHMEAGDQRQLHAYLQACHSRTQAKTAA